MSVSLPRGGNVNLSQEEPGLTRVLIGLGWDARGGDGAGFDLDASAFLLVTGDQVRHDADFVFYNNLFGADGAVEHIGDNRSGHEEGDGDDEALRVDLPRVPAEVRKIAVAVTIHEIEAHRRHFGMVADAYIRIVDDATGREIARYDLGDNASTETAMTFGELYRHGAEWCFRAVGQGYRGGLAPLARNYGVNTG